MNNDNQPYFDKTNYARAASGRNALPEEPWDENSEKTETKKNSYDDNNIPEIDLPKPDRATSVIPDEIPRRDGPGGE